MGFTMLAIILHLGNLEFTSWKAEQANLTPDSPIDKIAELLGIDKSKLSENLLRPKVKAGREFVTKSKKASEVKFSIDAFAKYLYEKLFQFIISKINENLYNEENTNGSFIGVLDIAGFEIFEINSFEQLCINYTNEKLQQFFNHHSFILEQSEYLRENISWEFIDFGQDLQPTIDLIETRQPMGILKLLDEECLMPKSSDQSFMERLSSTFNGKNKKFSDNKFKSGFIVHHYAGEVEYNVDNWLQKNTDPISENILSLLPDSTNEFISQIFSNDPHLGKRNSKLKTASQKHKDQLKTLMDQLESTEPHFVRCILPNLDKKSNKFDKNLVLGQLRCNGVLEGIRITRAGYPNRMVFDEFIVRYAIICGNEVFTKDNKTNSELILKNAKLDPETYKVGITKIFFKNGILGQLEALRDLSLKSIFTDLQRIIRGNLARSTFKQQIKEIQSAQIIARTMRTIDQVKSDNKWMELFFHIKPLLEDSVKVLDSKEMQENLKNVTVKLKDTEKLKNGLEKDNDKLREQLNKLEDEIISINTIIKDKDTNMAKLKAEEAKSFKQIQDLEMKIKDFQQSNQDLITEREKLNSRSLDLHDKHNQKIEELDNLTKLHETATLELTKLKQMLDETSKDKDVHSKELASIKSEHEKAIKEVNFENSKLQKMTEKLQSELKSHQSLLPEHAALKEEIGKLKKLVSDNESKISDQQSTITTLQTQLTKDDSNKSKYEKKLEEAKEKVSLLKSKVEKKSNEIDEYKQEVKSLKSELLNVKSKIDENDQVRRELTNLKSNESKHIDELNQMKQKLAAATTEHKSVESEYNKLKIEYDELKQTKNEYSTKIATLTSQLNKLNENMRTKEIEKENQPPDPQLMEEYTHMKIKLNEQSATLRREKFENKKLTEELQLIKERIMSGSLTSSDLTPKRRSLAIGDRSIVSNIESLNKEITNLKFQLQQEQGNFQRAENYAIELQKKVNKLQASRGLNSSTDYEKKYLKSEERVHQLEDKIEGIITSDESLSSMSSPRNSLLIRSDSISTVHALRGVSQDYVQIYQDVTKILRSTREELSVSKSEILRLKALLRESEDELYQVKQDNFKSSRNNYEEDLAQLKVKHETLISRNRDITDSLDVYKKRSEEYYKKLELAESAVSISKRHEEQARKEMTEAKSQLLLAKEEARTSQILIKQFRVKINSLEELLQDKNYKLEKCQTEIQELKDKLAYHVNNYENKEANEKLKEEIRNLHKDVNFKIETETTLIKENKKLQLDLEDAVLAKNNLQKELEDSVLREETLEFRIEELSNKARELGSEKVINERKISGFTKQVSGLKSLVDEISMERDRILQEKEVLEKDLKTLNSKFDNTTTELKQTQSELDFMKQHLENQREDSEAMKSELNQSKLSSTTDYRDQQKIRHELLVTKEENFSLQKTNKELNTKVSTLEEKLYSNEQLKYLESKVNSLSQSLDTAYGEKQEDEKTIKNLQRSIKELEIRVDNESQLSKRYNDENFDYQNKMNHYKSTIDILHNENVEKDLQLKSIERENTEMKETMLLLQKEVLELRERLHV
ncbi:MYO1 Myosin-1 [Candida maltosa Xu316]